MLIILIIITIMIMMSWMIETMRMTITITYDRRVTTNFMPKCWVNWCTNHGKPFLVGFLPLCSSYNFPSILCSSPWSDFRMTLEWNRVNKTARTNEWKESDLVYWMHTKLKHMAFGWLSERSNNASSILLVFFDRKTKSPCFDLFICWLIKHITNTYRKHFS